MKAIVAPRAGAQDALALMDVPIPEIDNDDVLVRIQAIGVGLHDRWFMPEDARFPYPIGIEAAGSIAEIGEAMTRFKPCGRSGCLASGPRTRYLWRAHPGPSGRWPSS